MKTVLSEAVPAITPQQVAAVVDRHVPVVLRYLAEHPQAYQIGTWHLMPPTFLLSQYADSHSRYHSDARIFEIAQREVAKVLNEPHPPFGPFDTAFEMSVLYECFRAAEGVLPAAEVEQLRARFRTIGEYFLENPWNFEADSRVSIPVLHAAGLGVCGWALDDDRMRGASRERVEEILTGHCDENGAPSELSASAYPQMVHWASQACEVESRPDLLRITTGIARLLPMLIYQPTLEPMGPDCRDQWKLPCRDAIDRLVLALRASAVLLSDGPSEWLARALFQKWVRDAKPSSAVYSPRAPHYLGVSRYDVGRGPADSPKLITDQVFESSEVLCALKRWLAPEVKAQRLTPPEEYRSSRRYVQRKARGKDVASIGNVFGPVSYVTPEFGLQGCELMTDDCFFWFDEFAFFPTAFSEDGFASYQAPYTPALRKEMNLPPADGVVSGVVRYGEHLIHLLNITCSQRLAPGVTTWTGLLLAADRRGEVVVRRGDRIARGPMLDEQEQCEWLLYPCGDRRFGFGLIHLDTDAPSDRLTNLRGDWCLLSLSRSAEELPGLNALAVLAIGPWTGTPEEYDAWLRSWRVEQDESGWVLTAPDARRLRVPLPPRGQK